MKDWRKLKWIAFGGIAATIVIAVTVGKFLSEGPSPLSFKVERYETNANEIVAFVHMKNVSERIAQYECEPGTKRLRCAYSNGKTNWISPPTEVYEFLFPGGAILAEIPLHRAEPISVGVMVRVAPPLHLSNPVSQFITNLRFRMAGMTTFKPCYLPEPLLKTDSE